MSEKTFAVLFPYQKAQIERLCWGDGCGKGHMGALDLGESMAVRCDEVECPYEDRHTDEPVGEVHGLDVHLRVLKGGE